MCFRAVDGWKLLRELVPLQVILRLPQATSLFDRKLNTLAAAPGVSQRLEDFLRFCRYQTPTMTGNL
jgi:hypothetical protein